MSQTTNGKGLTRNIPIIVKEEVRRRSKFGCVVCRSAICDYEHIIPEFKDAESHDPERICLLCPSCHAKVTRRQMSKRLVMKAYERVQNDLGILPPYSQFEFDSNEWFIDLGSSKFNAPKAVFSVDGHDLLSFSQSPEIRGLPELSGVFHDSKGRELLRIERNIWSAEVEDTWDIRIVGPKITICRDKGIVALEIILMPPHGIRITKLDMLYGEARFYIDPERFGLIVIERTAGSGKVSLGVSGECFGATSCVAVSTAFPLPYRISINIVGSQGIDLMGTGISWGVGSPSLLLKELAAWPLYPYLQI